MHSGQGKFLFLVRGVDLKVRGDQTKGRDTGTNLRNLLVTQRSRLLKVEILPKR